MRPPIPGVGSTKVVNPGGANMVKKIRGPTEFGDDVRYLVSIICINPMTAGFMTFHDCATQVETTPDNLVFKLVADLNAAAMTRAQGYTGPSPRVPIAPNPLNENGVVINLNIPIEFGLCCPQLDGSGEFVVTYAVLYADVVE